MRISELELQLSKKDQAPVASSGAEGKVSMELKWREGKKPPCEMCNGYVGMVPAVVDRNTLYIMDGKKIYAYDASTSVWSQLPDNSYKGCALTIVNNLLTFIGGNDIAIHNNLFSLTRKQNGEQWTEEFPPMLTKRSGACALCTGTALIVAGGKGRFGKVATTEVLNTDTLQWSTAVDLPQPTFGGSLLQVSNDHMYMLGAYNEGIKPIKSMFTCSLNALLLSCIPQSQRVRSSRSLSPSQVWRTVTNIPAIDLAYVSLYGQLLAVGGKDSDGQHITAIQLYNPSTNSWEVISHMEIPQRKSFTAILPDNQLIDN